MSDYRLEDEVRVPSPALQALSAAADRGGEVVASAVRDAGRCLLYTSDAADDLA